MKLLTTNSKLKKDGIVTFSLPAVKTCPFAGACKQYCYARKGCYSYGNVQRGLMARLKLTKDKPKFMKLMCEELDKSKATYVRIHSSGDFYSKEYIRQWFAIIRLYPYKQFYTYTKSIGWFKQLIGEQPENLRVIFSFGSKQDDLISTDFDLHAVIFRDTMPREYTDSSKSDLVAATCSNNRIGLILH